MEITVINITNISLITIISKIVTLYLYSVVELTLFSLYLTYSRDVFMRRAEGLAAFLEISEK